jgi:hypothetical protein
MKYISLMIFILLISCNPYSKTIDEKLNGSWAIEEIKYQNINYKDSLIMNTLFFEENNVIKLPETFNFENELTFYELDEKNLMINVSSKNQIFRGKYNLRFIKDSQKKILGIELKSKNTYLIAYKFLQNYDVDGIGW